MSTREQLLCDLLVLRRPTDSVLKELRTFGWDSGRDLAILQREHLKAVLGKFLSGELPAEEIERWADAVEGRDDIGFEAGQEEAIKSTIFRLANPEINRPLDATFAKYLMDELLS